MLHKFRDKMLTLGLLSLVLLQLTPLSCIEHNTDFMEEGRLWILPSDMHDSLFVKIELAETPSEMAQGLMYRRSMNKDEGMLFVYEYPQNMNFWMKNTYIPLDLIFIDEEGMIIDLAENTRALDENNISSTLNSKYVLEVNAGFCEENYVIIGDRIIWERLDLPD